MKPDRNWEHTVELPVLPGTGDDLIAYRYYAEILNGNKNEFVGEYDNLDQALGGFFRYLNAPPGRKYDRYLGDYHTIRYVTQDGQTDIIIDFGDLSYYGRILKA